MSDNMRLFTSTSAATNDETFESVLREEFDMVRDRLEEQNEVLTHEV